MARSHREEEQRQLEEEQRQRQLEQEQKSQQHSVVVGNAADPADPNHVVTVGEEQMARSNEMQKVGVDNYMKAHSGGDEAHSKPPEDPEEQERERRQHEQAQRGRR